MTWIRILYCIRRSLKLAWAFSIAPKTLEAWDCGLYICNGVAGVSTASRGLRPRCTLRNAVQHILQKTVMTTPFIQGRTWPVRSIRYCSTRTDRSHAISAVVIRTLNAMHGSSASFRIFPQHVFCWRSDLSDGSRPPVRQHPAPRRPVRINRSELR